jgi:RND family efflux transporter MFP subunit
MMNRPIALNRRLLTSLVCVLLAANLLSACQREVAEPPERIRAVKTITVGEQASDALRKFPGTVQPVETSNISFEVEGVIEEMRVDVGDRFKKGEVLAVLDKKPFELNVESAKASSSRARAQFEEKQSAYDRERRIQAEDPGATTEKAVEQARAAYMSQRENVSYRQAQLKLAKRDLVNAELRAPFEGTVSERYKEASEVAARGQRVLGIYALGAMQVAVSIPEQLIGGVSPGIEGQVFLANRPDRPYQAVVSEVGSAATRANAFPVKARISDADAAVRPGMTAELRLFFPDAAPQSAYLLPVHAIVFGTENDDRYIFVFDAQTSTVRKKAVQSKGRGVRGNQLIITEGIAPGDVIVVAGVNFLRDGQQVKLLKSSEPSQ